MCASTDCVCKQTYIHVWQHSGHIRRNYDSHINESVISLVWLRHVKRMPKSCHTYEWVLSYIWMRHTSHMNESYHIYECVRSNTRSAQTSCTHHVTSTPYIWMSRVTHMNESCHTHGWVVSHIRMYHFIQMNASCHTYGRIISRMKGILTRCIKHVISTSHMYFIRVSRINEPRHTWKWVKSDVWISHVACVGESCRTYEWVMSHIRKILTRNTKHVVSASHVWMVRVTHMNEIWMSHVTECHTHGERSPGIQHICYTY